MHGYRCTSCEYLDLYAPSQAKRVMMGNFRTAIGANLLYVPFASVMLVCYDKLVSGKADAWLAPPASDREHGALAPA